MRTMCAAVLCVAMLVTTGCNNDKDKDDDKPVPSTKPATKPVAKEQKPIDPIVLQLEQAITTAGTLAGLQEWAKKDLAAATECAKNLSSNITQQLLPYMKDQAKLKTSAEIQQLLQTSICDKLPAQVKLAMIAAFSVLDLYLPIPEPEKYMSENCIKLVTSFLTGLRDGCDAFVSPPASSRAAKASWLK